MEEMEQRHDALPSLAPRLPLRNQRVNGEGGWKKWNTGTVRG
jgi:hypothetical protein